MIGVDPATIHRLEASGAAKLDTLLAIANALDVPLNALTQPLPASVAGNGTANASPLIRSDTPDCPSS